MQFRFVVVVVVCAALMAYPGVSSAAESPADGSEVRESRSARSFDGWRPARKIERWQPAAAAEGMTTSDAASAGDPAPVCSGGPIACSVRVLAQSPDEDFDTSLPLGPTWSYPSRRSATSVPVPSYAGEVDTSREQRRPDSLALNAIGRSSYSTNHPTMRSNYSYQAPQYQSPEYDLPPQLPSFHGAPFDRPAPAYPTNSDPCAPCQEIPFDDPCARAYEDYRYSWDDIYFFSLFDAFRLDHESTRAGGRFGFNWGLPVFDDESGLGVQIGLSGSLVEEGPQWFATTGLFYRGDMRQNSAWNAGAVFDWMHDEETGTGIGQVRGMTSVTLDRKNEIGVWGALSVIDDFDKRGHKSESVNQANLFYRYLLDSGSDISVSVGWRADPDSPSVGGSWYVPINDYWAGLVGGYYAFEGDTWNVYSGVVRHWGNRARQDYIGQDRHMPYLPVADNSTMTLFHKP